MSVSQLPTFWSILFFNKNKFLGLKLMSQTLTSDLLFFPGAGDQADGISSRIVNLGFQAEYFYFLIKSWGMIIFKNFWRFSPLHDLASLVIGVFIK